MAKRSSPKAGRKPIVPFYLGMKGGEIVEKKRVKSNTVQPGGYLASLLDPEYRPKPVRRKRSYDKKKK